MKHSNSFRFYLDHIIVPKIVLVLITLLCLTSCGFHLRGSFNLPPQIKILKIIPDLPYEPFQRVLRKTLVLNGATIIDCGVPNDCAATLHLHNVSFVERPVAYGADTQVNRSTLQFNVSYEIVDSKGRCLISQRCIDVERDFTIVPNAVLGTEHERNIVQAELYQDASTLLIRQLSTICVTAD